jgi:hypothetical protein
MTAMKVLSVYIVMGSSYRMKKETNGSGALRVSRGVMTAARLVAVTVLHLHAMFAYMATFLLLCFMFYLRETHSTSVSHMFMYSFSYTIKHPYI